MESCPVYFPPAVKLLSVSSYRGSAIPIAWLLPRLSSIDLALKRLTYPLSPHLEPQSSLLTSSFPTSVRPSRSGIPGSLCHKTPSQERSGHLSCARAPHEVGCNARERSSHAGGVRPPIQRAPSHEESLVLAPASPPRTAPVQLAMVSRATMLRSPLRKRAPIGCQLG